MTSEKITVLFNVVTANRNSKTLVQLYAKVLDEDNEIELCIRPDKPITNSELVSYEDDVLEINGEEKSPLKTCSQAMGEFMCWLNSLAKGEDIAILLVSHNCKNFGAQSLIQCLKKAKIIKNVEDLTKDNIFFTDTMSFMPQSLKQITKKDLGSTFYQDGKKDTYSLQKALAMKSLDTDLLWSEKFSPITAYDVSVKCDRCPCAFRGRKKMADLREHKLSCRFVPY